jgi:hypothetical protein
MPYVRVYSQALPIEQQRVIGERLIEKGAWPRNIPSRTSAAPSQRQLKLDVIPALV